MTVENPATVVAEPGSPQVVGLRLYSRAPVSPRWLVESSVVAAVRALRDSHGAPIAYLRRGWLHGPHVELVGRTDDDRALNWSAVAELLKPVAPAPAEELTEEAYLSSAREFGRLEGVAPPYLPMRPHGTVEWLHRDEATAWPHPLDLLREAALTHLTWPLATALLDLSTHPEQARARLGEAFVSMAAAHRFGTEYGVFSFHSHAEAFLNWAAGRQDPRPAFDRRLKEDAGVLRPVVERGLAARPTPTAAGWDRALAHCMGLFEAATVGGWLTAATFESLAGEYDAATMGPPGGENVKGRGGSAFHQVISTSGLVENPSEWFAAYRLAINLFYQQLPLLSVSAMQRFYFCYAIANLVDEALGESWRARLDRLQSMRDPGRWP